MSITAMNWKPDRNHIGARQSESSVRRTKFRNQVMRRDQKVWECSAALGYWHNEESLRVA